MMSDNRNKTEIVRKQSYLDALRVLALFFVMYNHSSSYMALAGKSGFGYGISFFLSMICKSAVPLFFMISGVLLLGKNESFGNIFKKRIFRYIVVIIMFSFLCYIKMVLRERMTYSSVYFLGTIIKEPIYLPYWFLYSYLAFLMMLPILRPLAQNISKNEIFYLILLQVCFGSLKTVFSYFGGISISNFFEFGGLFQSSIFYPLIGCGLIRFVKEERFLSRSNVLRNLVIVPVAIITEQIVYMEYLEGKGFQETYLGTWIPVVSIVLFLDMRILFREENLSERGKRVLSEVGSCVFGCYLLSGIVGTGGRLGFFYRMMVPVLGELMTCVIRIICDFLVQVSIVMVLKKVPGVRKVI